MARTLLWGSKVQDKTKLLIRNQPPEIKALFAVTYIYCMTGGWGCSQISLHWSYLSSTVVFLYL